MNIIILPYRRRFNKYGYQRCKTSNDPGLDKNRSTNNQ